MAIMGHQCAVASAVGNTAIITSGDGGAREGYVQGAFGSIIPAARLNIGITVIEFSNDALDGANTRIAAQESGVPQNQWAQCVVTEVDSGLPVTTYFSAGATSYAAGVWTYALGPTADGLTPGVRYRMVFS